MTSRRSIGWHVLLVLSGWLVGCQAPGPYPTLQLGAATVPATLPTKSDTGALMARLAPGVPLARVVSQAAALGFTRQADLTLGGRPLLKLSPPAGLAALEARSRLSAVAGIESVTTEPRYALEKYPFTKPDTELAEQWAHQATHADTIDAWDKVPVASQGKIVVAVIDTGLDVSHPEFAGRIVAPANYVNRDTAGNPTTDVTDSNGHGTHVAGIIGARGDNGMGVAGVAWGVGIMPLQFTSATGSGGEFDILDGFLAALRYQDPVTGARVRVINMSFGNVAGVDSYFAEAIAAARDAGVVVVAAAGNDGRAGVDSPANTPYCLAVGATGSYGMWETLAPFSNYGDRLDLTAPGVDIWSTLPGNTYGKLSGTSMAAPFVSGVAALVVAKYDPLNANANAAFVDKVIARLRASTDDLGPPGWDPNYGCGRINAAKAVAPDTLD